MPQLELRDYQVEGIEFLRDRKRALLADQPGLGKTVQATEAAVKPVVVIAPTYLTRQWFDFLTEQYPNDVIALAEGSRAQREREISQPADWLIVNTQMARSYALPRNLRTLIIDEAHYIRNRDAMHSRVIAKYAQLAEYCFLLTATPIVKEADDIWHLLYTIDKDEFSSYDRFVYRWLRVNYNPWRSEVMGVRNISRMREMLSKYALWRTYKEVRLQLPDLLPPNYVTVNFEPHNMRQYKTTKDFYISKDGIPFEAAIQVIQALRRMTVCTEKLEALKALIEDVDGTRPIVVFTWYQDTCQQVTDYLNENCPGLAVAITGNVDPHKRAQIVKNPKYNYRVATLASLSEGVDLSDSRTVIFFEEDYTPGTMYQARSRVQRWSQSGDNEPVRQYYIHIKDTIDQHVHKMQSNRHATILDLMKEALK